MKKALITGITGQDGSYLAELLLEKDYEVHGMVRRSSMFNRGRIDHIYVDPHAKGAHLFLHYSDLADAGNITSLIYNVAPDEIYHLGAQSHVRVSFDVPEYTGDVTGLGTTRILDAMHRSGSKARFYQASSSEMFGATQPPQNESSPFYPRSPYAAAKVYAYWMTVNYREAYGMYACNGILFNHESPRRGENFITRKITLSLANILAGRAEKLYLGNLEARRDWGFAPEYVECQWRILQQDRPADYVIGTGESHSVREFLLEAFEYAGIGLELKGTGAGIKGVISSVRGDCPLKPGHVVLEIDPKFFRPTEVDYLLADITRSREVLGWEPKVTFKELVRIMVDADLIGHGLAAPGDGQRVLKEKGLTWFKADSTSR